MKLFETPEMEIVKFEVADVVTTSDAQETPGYEPSFGLGNCA